MVRFKWLTGDVNFLAYGGKWISNRCSNGEFNYWFVIELTNWQDACGRDAPKEKYNISLSVVAPSEAGEAMRQSAMESCGLDQATAFLGPLGREQEVEILHSYGAGVPVWNGNGSGYKELMNQARQQARQTEMLFGFAMDHPVNALGTTGWEHMRGMKS